MQNALKKSSDVSWTAAQSNRPAKSWRTTANTSTISVMSINVTKSSLLVLVCYTVPTSCSTWNNWEYNTDQVKLAAVQGFIQEAFALPWKSRVPYHYLKFPGGKPPPPLYIKHNDQGVVLPSFPGLTQQYTVKCHSASNEHRVRPGNKTRVDPT